ncbi:Beta-barrel assembly machine subunit BamE [Alkalispirillum mobile]|uniref:Outer membrane protein assembly factor BamE n=1 Tax=Alkalispirillum mobile TaxID=85925 RepID=A0A498CEA8_9GAMM|nr:outer membrane protein assembly factor BamE [Alkalispirillum mobile]RLK50768.1 Beta-barrel assembly machine subunit BamE [Alkalispirillum mobile]
MGKRTLFALYITTTLLVTGCAQVDRIPFTHQRDAQQGNIMTQEMVDELRPGMSQQQVRRIMGPPAVVDPFRTDRWDYVHTLRPGGGSMEKKRMTLKFEDGRLVDISGDLRPGHWEDS